MTHLLLHKTPNLVSSEPGAAQTLQSDRKRRFVLMNNGVTIIARNMTHTGSKFVIEDFQIMNGCQTSHVLFDHASDLDESVLIPLRLIWPKKRTLLRISFTQRTNRRKLQENNFLQSLI